MPTDPPATLAAWLRTRSDEQLSALLAARPDVARPAAVRRGGPRQPARRPGVGGPRARRTRRRDAAGPRRRAAGPDRRGGTRRDRRGAPRRPGRRARRRRWSGSPPARCCGATTCCGPPTRSAAPSAIPRAWAAGRPSCGSPCPPTCRARWPTWTRTSGRCSTGWPASGRSATCPTPPPTAGAPRRGGCSHRRPARPHRRPQRRTAPRDRSAPARRRAVRTAPAATRARRQHARAGLGRPAGGRRGPGERRQGR